MDCDEKDSHAGNARARRWCFTLNNPTEENETLLNDLLTEDGSGVAYFCYGRETAPTTGTPHLQGYFEFHNRKTHAQAMEWFAKANARPYVTKARGSQKQNIAYCSKDADDGSFLEWGERNKMGQRVDISEFLAAARAGATDIELSIQFPDEYAKYYKAAERIQKLTRTASGKEALARKYRHCQFKPWQKEALDRLSSQDDRRVLWICGKQGNEGKTWLALYLVCKDNAYYVQAGKESDIAYAFKDQNTVVFDLTRSKEETCSYSSMEAFKNGVLFSAKYESQTKIFEPCKVVVFANWMPDLSKLSDDRWEIMNLDQPALSTPMVEEVPEPLQERSNAVVLEEEDMIAAELCNEQRLNAFYATNPRVKWPF